MKKNMYSLILMEEVINQVDKVAHMKNTNRSNLINQILAEYLNVKTPEMIMSEMIDDIMNLIQGHELQIKAPSTDTTLKIKSSLEYKYRPTVNYSLELFRTRETKIGGLTAQFRTQSPELKLELFNFFKLWIEVEGDFLTSYNLNREIEYDPNLGKFKRNFVTSLASDISNKDISYSIANYIKFLDLILKKYLSKEITNYNHIKKEYLNFLNKEVVII